MPFTNLTLKNFAICLVIFLGLFNSCIYEKQAATILPKQEPSIPKLVVLGLADSSIIIPQSKQKFTANLAAKWLLTNSKAGIVDSTGLFTAGNTEGVFTIMAVNKSNLLDTLKTRILILKQAILLSDLRKGGYILSFRHAAASTGSDQTSSKVENWWKSCESTTARQITKPIGLNQSDSTGQVMRFLKIPVDTTFTSEFCRCKQTVEYFKLGVPNVEVKELTYYVYDEANRYANSMSFFAKRPISNKNYVSVVHAGFSKMPAFAPMATLDWGDCAVFKQVLPGTEPYYITTIKVKDWTSLAKILK